MNYHKIFTGLWKSSAEKSLQVEKTALQNCSLAIYPSNWAVDSAVKDYGIDNEKIKVIPFGANIDAIPAAFEKKKGNICKLLFIGVDWQGKGGEIAVECLYELIRMKIDATLTVVGCEVPHQFKHEKIINYTFLNKNIPDQAQLLEKLFKESTFFILPTRVDAYGLVFCEASAYGLPSLGANTGGVGGALHDGINGCLLPYSAGGKDYAKKIAELFSNEELYLSLSRSSRKLFEEKLNWDAFAKNLQELIGKGNLIH